MTNRDFSLNTDAQDMRDAYCDALIAAAEADARLLVLDCDLANSMGTARFHKRFPERAFDLGHYGSERLLPWRRAYALWDSCRLCTPFATFASPPHPRPNLPLLRLRGTERQDHGRGTRA